MAESGDLRPIIGEMGLTTYESRIWQALLEKGEADARDLIRATGVPFGRVYDVLSDLAEKGIVEVQDTRPKRFRPRPVAGAVERLVAARRSAMREENERLEEAAEELRRRFASLGRALRREDVFVTVAVGEADIERLIHERTEAAEEELLIALGRIEASAGFPGWMEDALHRMGEAAARGVSVKVLVPDEVPRVVPDLRFLKADARRRLQARVVPGGPPTDFKVIDRRYVVLELVDPYEPAQRVAMVQLLSKKLADHMARMFDRYWNASRPLRLS